MKLTDMSPQSDANSVKEILFEGLCASGEITAEQRDRWKNEYAIVLRRKNWLGNAISKLFGDDDRNDFNITFVKVISS